MEFFVGSSHARPKPLLSLVVLLAVAPTVPARAAEEPHRPKSFAIQGARLVPVSGPAIENGTIVLEDGLITALGPEVKIPPAAWVIEGQGLTVYPGLIDAMSSVGLPDAGRGGRGSGGSSGNQADLPISAGPEDRPATTTWRLAADVFNPTADTIRAWRDAGFTSAVVAPLDGILPGQAAVMNLGGQRASEMVIQPQCALIVNIEHSEGYRGFPGSLLGHIAYVKQIFLDAEQYRTAWAVYRADPRGLARPAYDRTLEPLLPALSEGRPVLYPGNLAKQIYRALDVSKELDFPLIVYGAQEGYEVAQILARRKVPVLVNLEWPEKARDADPEEEEPLRVLRLRDRAPGTPAAFEKAGVKFAFYSGGIRAAEQILPKVRAAIDQGLSPEAALRALTLSAAEIYGVDNRLGSLDTGKIANLLVTEGNLFAEKPKLKMVFVDGRKYEIRPVREEKREQNEKEGGTP
jgi:imidazolonepropionase-like amidohydrolase